MPIINISLYQGKTDRWKKDLCEIIKKSIKEIFSIERDIFHHRIYEFNSVDMIVPEICSNNYISIKLDIMPGRSKNDKELLFKKLHKELLEFGIDTKDIIIIIREPLLENWYIRGKTGTEIKGTE